MNINRHNYEEFFLLYVDNELSAQEKNAVDVFVGDNPDLQEELMLLQQSVINPEPVIFENKNELLKNEEFAQLQERLLLYMDNELSIADEQSIAALISTDAKVHHEFNSLRQTRLEPVTTLFPNKQLLYRTEAVKIVPMKWWRIAAAAVLLLGIGVWSGITVYKNYAKPAAGEVVVVKDNGQPKQDKVNETVLPVTPDASLKKNNIAEEKLVSPVVPKDNLVQQTVQKTNQPTERISPLSNNKPKENVVSNKPVEKPSNNLPKPYFENNNRNKSNETAISNVPLKKDNSSNINSGNDNAVVQTNPKEKLNDPKVTDINSNAADPKNTAALQAVYKPNDRFVEMDEDKAKHSKVGGFLRRVKRVLERTANIKTGDEIKVAGFEIAIK